MTQVTHDTFSLTRLFAKSPDRVFGMFRDAAKKRRWFAENDDHVIEQFDLDFSVGGVERLSYRFKEGSPFAGHLITSHGHHLDIEPDKRILIASTMAFGDRRISASLLTAEFVATTSGTTLICTHQGAFFEGSDGPEGRKHGWSVLLDRLEKELDVQ